MQEANKCIYDLSRNEASLVYLFDINALITEEIALVNSELYSTIELVLQYAMESDLKAGGKLVISNRDSY